MKTRQQLIQKIKQLEEEESKVMQELGELYEKEKVCLKEIPKTSKKWYNKSRGRIVSQRPVTRPRLNRRSYGNTSPPV